MEYTSAQANKLLKKLQEDRLSLLGREELRSSFVAATVENVEDARPEYDYESVQRQLEDIEGKIRYVKHCINAFNLSHEVEGFSMTVDQMLVYIPQLSEKKLKLAGMAAALEKARVEGSGVSGIIEYRYANYDVEKAARDYEAVSGELSAAQTALDKLNNTLTMTIDL